MAIVRILLLSLAAIAVPILGFSMDIEQTDQGALCGGRPYARVSVPNGASPYVELTADGVTRSILAGLWRNAKLAVRGVVFRAGRIDENGGDLASGHRKSRFSPRPLLPFASTGKRTTRGHRRRPPVPVYRPTDGQHGVPERRNLSTRGAYRAWFHPCRSERLFLLRPFQGRRSPSQRSGRFLAARGCSRLGANRHRLRGFRLLPLDRHQPGFIRPARRKWRQARPGPRHRHLDMRRTRALACLSRQGPPAQH